MNLPHRIVLTGGGTGGHIYPALAVAEQLKKDANVEAILYIGAHGHKEEELAQQHGLDFVGLSVSGLPRQFSLELITWPWQFLSAVQKARSVLNQFKPTVILGTGGYASAAPLAAAVLTNRPFALHEPDAHPGLVNRVFARYAKLISLGMASACDHFKQTNAAVVFIGNPVAKRFLDLPSREKALADLGLDANKKTVVVTGGSQGAAALNQAIWQLLPKLAQENNSIQIVHQVGEKNWQEMKSNLPTEWKQNSFYKPAKYFERLEIPYAASDLTICRAGAMTLSELFVTGTPAILVPYPFAAQNHQTFNARFVEAQGGAKVLLQSDINAERLYELITGLLKNEAELGNMKKQMLTLARPRAAADLADRLKKIV